MPINRRTDLDEFFPGHRVYKRTPEMPVQFVEPEPDEYERGDGMQRHMDMDEVEHREPLGAVLRDDSPDEVARYRIKFRAHPHTPEGSYPQMSIGPLLDHFGVPRETFLPPARKSFLSRTWDRYHEWIAAGVIIFVASFICFG